MRYRQWAPHPSVAAMIDCWWTLDGDPGPGATSHAILPDGHVELVFHCGDPMMRVHADGTMDRQQRVLVIGQMSTVTALRPLGLVSVAGVRLRPAGVRAVLGVPASELVDRIEELRSVSAALATQLGPFATASGNEAAPAAIERQLTEALQHRRPDPITARAVALIEATHGRASIDRVLRNGGIGARDLERRFQRDVGLAPKAFSRVVRFQRAVTALVDGSPRLIDAALSGGYYDQSHFTREFKAFAGVPPNAWFSRDCQLSSYFTTAHRERARGLGARP